jgi:uncharacterized surface protein with fasciclin (FAS1) repeats
VKGFFGRHLQYDGALCHPNAFDTAAEYADLSTFVFYLERAGLSEIFLCAGPFTVLAPTNDAFASLDAAFLMELLRPENQKRLQDFLLYHILPGFYLSTNFEAGNVDTLLTGQDVTVYLDPLMFNQAGVVTENVLSCNGVMHTIDAVLIPGGKFWTQTLTYWQFNFSHICRWLYENRAD